MRVPIKVLKQAALMKSLHYRWGRLERCERVLDPLLPFSVRKIASECNAAAAPAERRKSAHFQQKVPIFLTELGGFAPIVNLQSGNHRVLRQRRWVQQPRVGDHFLQLDKIFVAQFASPKFSKRLKPKKREPHFLFEIWFDRRRNGDLALCVCA